MGELLNCEVKTVHWKLKAVEFQRGSLLFTSMYLSYPIISGFKFLLQSTLLTLEAANLSV